MWGSTRRVYQHKHAFWLAGIVFAVGALASEVKAQEFPPELQVALFSKIFSYDKGLRELGPKNIKLGILAANRQDQKLEALLTKFVAAGIQAEMVSLPDLERRITSLSVLYVQGEELPADVKEICVRNHVLTIGMSPKLVERGDIAVALGTANGRPQINVHLARLSQEGHSFASELLALSKVHR